MKFDICLMNPPYDRDLHMQFFNKSLDILKMVNEDEQWDFCTDDVLARRANEAERLVKEISDVVFQRELPTT